MCAISKANIAKHELIGLEVEVLLAPHRGHVGVRGRITDETKNTITVLQENKKEICLPKDGLHINVTTESGELELDCTRIMFRPEDRIKKVRR
jgi:ribonuclease P protein subunit POP4